MIVDRGNLCDICKHPETRMRDGKLLPLCVDHVEGTKILRGLLCSNCNIALGLFRHDRQRIKAAWRYLKEAGE